MAEEIDLRAIRAFVAVVEAGDFTSAARSLRMTRSAVGKALARLEDALAVRLMHRTTRQVSTTSDGAVFFERCVRILADLDEAENAIRHRTQEPRGLLKLSVPDAYGRWRIHPILTDYMRRWPTIQVEVSYSDRIDNIVEEGLDLAIRIGGVEASTGLITRVVDRIDAVFCASPAYLASRGTPDARAALEGHDLLVFDHRNRVMPWPWRDPFITARSRQRPRMMLDSAEAVRMAALEGLGVAYLPNFLASSDLVSGRLIALPSGAAEAIDVHALYPDRRLLRARARLFLDMVLAALP